MDARCFQLGSSSMAAPSRVHALALPLQEVDKVRLAVEASIALHKRARSALGIPSQPLSVPARVTMTGRSGSGEKRSRPHSESSGSLAEGHEPESTKYTPPRLESRTPPSCTLTVGFDAQLRVCRLTYLAGWHTNAQRLR